MKLPRLPNPGNALDAKYTKEQMHAYAMKAIENFRQDMPSLIPIASYLENGFEPKEAAKDLRFIEEKIYSKARL